MESSGSFKRASFSFFSVLSNNVLYDFAIDRFKGEFLGFADTSGIIK